LFAVNFIIKNFFFLLVLILSILKILKISENQLAEHHANEKKLPESGYKCKDRCIIGEMTPRTPKEKIHIMLKLIHSSQHSESRIVNMFGAAIRTFGKAQLLPLFSPMILPLRAYKVCATDYDTRKLAPNGLTKF